MTDTTTDLPTVRRSRTHPMTNPALAVELSMREREALMVPDDWGELVDVVLGRPLPEEPTDAAGAAQKAREQ